VWYYKEYFPVEEETDEKERPDKEGPSSSGPFSPKVTPRVQLRRGGSRQAGKCYWFWFGEEITLLTTHKLYCITFYHRLRSTLSSIVPYLYVIPMMGESGQPRVAYSLTPTLPLKAYTTPAI
jgi:hypothetical protein